MKIVWNKKMAKYHGIPCYYCEETKELIGRNWLYDKLVGFMVWWDVNIANVESFKIKIIE